MRKEIATDHYQMPLLDTEISIGSNVALPLIRSERLPTNTTTSKHPIHRWFNFIAGFSPEFVDIVCRTSLMAQRPALLLDPFAGCGTAPLEAVAQGIDAVGYEAHPFFEKICRAKLCGLQGLRQLSSIEKVIGIGFDNPVSTTELSESQKLFLEKLFPEHILERLLGAREALFASHLIDEPLAFLALSKILERSSHSSTDGIYKAPTSKKRAISPSEAASSVFDMIRADLESMSSKKLSHKAQIFGKSSEVMAELADGSVSIVVTSPPYINNFDYAEMARMQLYFWNMASSWGDITEKVRSRLIVNTTTALKGHKHLQQDYRNEISSVVLTELDQITSKLGVLRTQKAGKKEYDLLVYPYFAQMTRVLRECFRVMRPNASMHMMVADSALYGVHIKAPQILSRILEEMHFKNVKCKLVRKRGHRWLLAKREGADEGLGEYYIQATR